MKIVVDSGADVMGGVIEFVLFSVNLERDDETVIDKLVVVMVAD